MFNKFFSRCTGLALCLTLANVGFSQGIDDSTFVYRNGQGLTITLGKGEGTKINLLTTTQPGMQFQQLDSGKTVNTNRITLNMARIALEGSTLKNKVTMGLVTDFTGTSPLLEGWLGFAISKRAKLFFGQRQTHTNNRLAMADERFAQVMGQTIAGRSNDGLLYGGLMHNFVSTSREGGLYLETNFTLGGMRIYPSVSITTGQGQNFFDERDEKGFKYGGRLDVMPLGDFKGNNAFIAHDLYRESTLKLAIGVAGSINNNARSVDGSGPPTLAPIYDDEGNIEYANYHKLAADFMVKYRGFALVGEFMDGAVNGTNLFTNRAGTNRLTEEVASQFYHLGQAFNLQSSYVFKNGWVVDGRWSMVRPEFDIATSLIRKENWLTLGGNRYLMNNALKIGANVSYITEEGPVKTIKRWVGNLAVQILL